MSYPDALFTLLHSSLIILDFLLYVPFTFPEAPIKMITQNAGIEGAIVIENILNKHDKNYGYNALTNEYVNMIESGIIDPTKVTRTALENAGSVASTLLTTEVLVCDIEEKINPKDPNAIPQAYGM